MQWSFEILVSEGMSVRGTMIGWDFVELGIINNLWVSEALGTSQLWKYSEFYLGESKHRCKEIFQINKQIIIYLFTTIWPVWFSYNREYGRIIKQSIPIHRLHQSEVDDIIKATRHLGEQEMFGLSYWGEGKVLWGGTPNNVQNLWNNCHF